MTWTVRFADELFEQIETNARTMLAGELPARSDTLFSNRAQDSFRIQAGSGKQFAIGLFIPYLQQSDYAPQLQTS